jgi:glycosyltransferase involved in cell wall biosynthesis
MNNKKSVLVVGVDTEKQGGVANYYSIFKKYCSKKVRYFTIGSRKGESNFVDTLFRIVKDYYFFIKNLKTQKYKIIHINPSLDAKSIIRDGIFIIISKIMKRKIIVMFRGWDDKFEKKMEKYFLPIFKFVYFKSDALIVLGSLFKEKLISWGYKKKIYIETTAIDDQLLNKFSIDKFKERWEKNKKEINLLFLARIEKDKGIYETINIYKMMKKNYPFVRLCIAGDGSELGRVKNYILKENVRDVKIFGYVKGTKKDNLFKNSDIFIFPTFHGEGMPTNVLEAMSYGLPVITNAVGGLNDFFRNGEMGFISKFNSSKFFIEKLSRLISDKDLRYKISLYNYKYSRSRFRASNCKNRIYRIWNSLI